MGAPLETEIKTYNDKLSEMLGHVGKFVLISGHDVHGYFDAYTDALKDGYAKHPDGRFLVKRIAPQEQVAFFTRDLVFECHQ